MRIALFHNLPAGGAKRALYEHARRLRERGHTLDAYVPTTAAEEYLPLRGLCENFYSYDLAVREAGPTAGHLSPSLWRLLGAKGAGFARNLANVRARHRALDAVWGVYGRIARDINGHGYDVAYVHQCRVSLSPPLLRMLRCPSVYYCQDSLREAHEWTLETRADYDRVQDSFYVRKRFGNLRTLPTLRLIERQEREFVSNTRATTLVLANSWYSREAILRTTGVNARVCYLGVDSDFFRPDPSIVREHEVLSVGALLPNKRHDFVLQAVACIPAARRPRMRIIGYELDYGTKTLGPVAKRLLWLAEERGVDLRIDKEVSDEALRDGYRRASVVAFAPYLEPFGLVPLEAMACQAPVAGVSEGGVRETIVDGVTGFLTGLDAPAFGRALDRALCDKTRAREMGERGRAAVTRRWTWDRSVDTLECCFEAAPGRGAGER